MDWLDLLAVQGILKSLLQHYSSNTSILWLSEFFVVQLLHTGIEAEDIKKGWQEYTELYKKDLYDPGNHDGVITHLEPDTWSSKSSGP